MLIRIRYKLSKVAHSHTGRRAAKLPLPFCPLVAISISGVRLWWHVLGLQLLQLAIFSKMLVQPLQ
eukprot:COSAG02_NODE_2288_length_9212_cov_11.304071_6_plen_66_part_00